MDDVFIERIRRSVDCERAYLFEHATSPAQRATLEEWFHHDNHRGLHEKLGGLAPAVG